MIEWSSVSREASGSYFSGSFEPEPMTVCVWWLVRTTISRTRGEIRASSRRRRSNARSISAWAWYSAECAFV